MPSLVEFAELCLASYDERNEVPITLQQRSVKWKLADFRKEGGFYAALYARIGGGGRVLAFRGTDDWTDVLSDDFSIAAGGVPPTVRLALQMPIGNVRDMMVAGHSLGGALAIIAAARFGVPAVTFNAPGVMDSCLATSPGAATSGLRALLLMVTRCLVGQRVHNVRINADPVSSPWLTGMQPGVRQTMAAPQCGLNLKCRHGIRTCVEAVRSNQANYQDLKI